MVFVGSQDRVGTVRAQNICVPAPRIFALDSRLALPCVIVALADVVAAASLASSCCGLFRIAMLCDAGSLFVAFIGFVRSGFPCVSLGRVLHSVFWGVVSRVVQPGYSLLCVACGRFGKLRFERTSGSTRC